MCRVQREKTGIRDSAGVYCGRARAKMEILGHCLPVEGMKADHSTTIYARLLP